MRNLSGLGGLIILLAGNGAVANDTMVTLGAGGLAPKKAVQVSMQEEVLRISPGRISIDYVFKNHSRHDQRVLVAFPLPDLDGESLQFRPHQIPYETGDNFVGFALTQEGRSVPVQLERRATYKRQDVTARLKALGFDIGVDAARVTQHFLSLPLATQRALIKSGLIGQEDGAPKAIAYYARWTLKAQYYWQQTFPAGQNLRLHQTYRPIVGGAGTVSDDGAYLTKSHCGTKPQTEQILQQNRAIELQRGEGYGLVEKNIRYILKTARNWKGPIARFHLILETETPNDILLVCFPGLTKTSNTTYEAKITDFVPARDLDISILQIPSIR